MAVFAVRMSAIVVATASTIIQIKAGPSRPFELLLAVISQGISETVTMENVIIVRKTDAAVVTAFTPIAYSAGANSSVVVGSEATGIYASDEGITTVDDGTDGDILVDEGFEITKGWSWFPRTAREKITVPPNGVIGLKFPTPPASATWRARMVFAE